jgi:predicted O-methyltransferase YrrM
MRYLEKSESERKEKGLYSEILWQIPKETGEFIAFMAMGVPNGQYIEIGTAGGYSALWIALACRESGRKLTTFEIDESKAKISKETFDKTDNNKIIDLVIGDALDFLHDYKNISFCFLDTDNKGIYEECYNTVIENMVKGGIFIGDNAISHKFELESMLKMVFDDKRTDAIIIPVGKGQLVCRKL